MSLATLTSPTSRCVAQALEADVLSTLYFHVLIFRLFSDAFPFQIAIPLLVRDQTKVR